MKREAGAEVMGSGRVSELNKRIEEKKTSKVQEVKQCSVLAADNVRRRRINSGRRKSQRSKQTSAEKLQLASLSVVSMIEKKSGTEGGKTQQVVQMENTVSRLCPLNSQSNSVGWSMGDTAVVVHDKNKARYKDVRVKQLNQGAVQDLCITDDTFASWYYTNYGSEMRREMNPNFEWWYAGYREGLCSAEGIGIIQASGSVDSMRHQPASIVGHEGVIIKD